MTEQLAFWGMPQRRRRQGRPSRRANLQRALDICATYADLTAGAEPVNARPRGPEMWILMGDESWRDPWLENVGLAARGLYWTALSWAKDQTRGRDVPSAVSVLGDLDSWFIPVGQIRYWKATREAKQLAEAGIWIDVLAGYRYVYLADENKPKTLLDMRSKNVRKQRAKRVRDHGAGPPDCADGGW